ncbi:MAG: response regulator [Isosphaeraceae bacterium]|nr:response regulator [Isosphaeraceae bacterium]
MPTALIVEDEVDANELLAMLVRLRGYQTESAFTGTQALEMAGRIRPDILFLDLMLPDITGYDVCAELKTKRATCDIPIVMVSARIADESRRKGIRLGAGDYIPKPYTPDQIFQAMTEADARRSQAERIDGPECFPLDLGDDLAPFRHLGALRGRLLARTDAPEDRVARWIDALAELLQRGLDWGRGRPRSRVAAVECRIDPQDLVVELLDESGWLAADPPTENGLARVLESGRFERIEHDPDSCRLIIAAPLN